MHPLAVIFDYNRTVFDPDSGGLVTGASALLKELTRRGVTLFLVAKGGDERRAQITALGLEPLFKKIIVNESKSSEDYLSCKNLCTPGTVFYAVGDRVKEEIRHANSCGMTTIWFRSGKFATEEPADASERPAHTVTSLDDVAALIK